MDASISAMAAPADRISQLTAEELASFQQIKAKINPSQLAHLGDDMLMRLMFSRKLDVDRTLELVNSHFAMRDKYHYDNFASRVPEIHSYLQSGMQQYLPGTRAKDGAGILYIFPRFMPTTGVPPAIHQIIGGWYFGSLVSLDSLDNDRRGCWIVEDFSGASLRQFASMSSSDMKEVMEATQNAMPGRIRGILIINAPWWIHLLAAIAKAFMKKKLQDKVRVLGSPTDLYQFIDKSQLSPLVGGTATDTWPVFLQQLLNPATPLSLVSRPAALTAQCDSQSDLSSCSSAALSSTATTTTTATTTATPTLSRSAGSCGPSGCLIVDDSHKCSSPVLA